MDFPGPAGTVQSDYRTDAHKPIQGRQRRIRHLAGDAVLIAVARRLALELPRGDTLARFGGDEFVLLCHVTDTADALRRATRLQAALTAGFDVCPDTNLSVTASIGIAVMSQGDEPARWLIRESDMAMHQAKAQGRNRIAIAPVHPARNS